MAQLYIQKNAQPDTWVMSGAPTATTLFLSLAATINYSDDPSHPDTLPANVLAVLPDATSVFDRTNDVYVGYTVKGSNVLSVIKESLLPTLTSDYAPICRVEMHGIKPYQPEPYLASGGSGAGAGAAATTVDTSAATRVRSLWNGAANDAPPSGWADVGYDDSAWAAATIVTPLGPGEHAPSGTSAIWSGAAPLSTTEQCLFRIRFVLPAGAVSGATILLGLDDYIHGSGAGPTTGTIWVNGTATSVDIGTPVQMQDSGGVTSALPAGLFRPGGANVVALWVDNAAPAYAWLGAELSVQSGAPLANPGGGEGALLYYHDGAWTDLPAGTNGYELTLVSGDPAWTAQPASGGTVTSVALAGPTGTTVSGSPITGAGTLTLSWASQSANTVLAAPNGSSGAPTFRALVGADIPVDASTIISSAGVITGNYQAGSGVGISGNTISATGSGGSVTSVALTLPGFLSVSGSPITTSGTLAVTLASETANTIFAGPSSGSAAAPTFRTLAAADLPAAAAAGGHVHAHSTFL